MIHKISTVAFQGIQAIEVVVKVQISPGLPAFTIVGLADKAVSESKERVRASFHHMGLSLPPKRITINLAPADIQKEGTHYDLPIALGLMGALGIIDNIELNHYIAIGELGLDGSLASVVGALPAALNAHAQEKGLICPASSGQEAAWAGNLEILAAPSLMSLINHFKGNQILAPPLSKITTPLSHPKVQLSDVKGQPLAKRALEIAAAGGHNILMIGPPGTGKSMLARCLPTLLPPLEASEALEVTMIHSLGGILPEEGLIQERPFRDPHHSSSLISLIGGGVRTKPGEISLAHHGVLFLDELPEFSRSTLESLRQPLETGKIIVARANNHVTYPARIQLIAAMNPCRCGYFGDLNRQCHRVPICATDYQNKISGPLMDRFDLTIQVSKLRPDELLDPPECSFALSSIKERIFSAREIQRNRNADYPLNAVIDGEHLKEMTQIDNEGKSLLYKAIEKMGLSGRGYHRILRVSRTIADLEQSPTLQRHHISEAIGYRQ